MGHFDATQVHMGQVRQHQAAFRTLTDDYETRIAEFEVAHPTVSTATTREYLARVRADLNFSSADLLLLDAVMESLEGQVGSIAGERLQVPLTLHQPTVVGDGTIQIAIGPAAGFNAAFHRPTVSREGAANSDPYVNEPWYYPLTIQLDHGAPAGVPTISNAVYSGGGDRDGFHMVIDLGADTYGLYHTDGSAVYSNFTIESEDMNWKAVLVRGNSPDVVEFRYGKITGGQDCFYTDDGFSGYLVDPLLYRCYIAGPVYPDFGDPHTDATQAEGATLRLVESLCVAPLNNQNAVLQGGGTIDGTICVGGAFFAHGSGVTISNSLLVYDSTLYETDQGTTAPWVDGGGNTWVTMAELATMMDDPTVIRGRRPGGAWWHLAANGTVQEGLPA